MEIPKSTVVFMGTQVCWRRPIGLEVTLVAGVLRALLWHLSNRSDHKMCGTRKSKVTHMSTSHLHFSWNVTATVLIHWQCLGQLEE